MGPLGEAHGGRQPSSHVAWRGRWPGSWPNPWNVVEGLVPTGAKPVSEAPHRAAGTISGVGPGTGAGVTPPLPAKNSPRGREEPIPVKFTDGKTCPRARNQVCRCPGRGLGARMPRLVHHPGGERKVCNGGAALAAQRGRLCTCSGVGTPPGPVRELGAHVPRGQNKESVQLTNCFP